MNVNGQRHDRIAAVVYGSETGNALEYAEEAGRILERLHFRTIVQPLDALEPVRRCCLRPQHVVLFLNRLIHESCHCRASTS